MTSKYFDGFFVSENHNFFLPALVYSNIQSLYIVQLKLTKVNLYLNLKLGVRRELYIKITIVPFILLSYLQYQ